MMACASPRLNPVSGSSMQGIEPEGHVQKFELQVFEIPIAPETF